MSNEVFPLEVDSPYDEELIYNTVVSGSEGGKEYRFEKWQYPKRVFTVNLSARDSDDMQSVWEFYIRHRGAYDSFLFENPNESSSNSPVSNDVFATGDGVDTKFYIGAKFDLPTGDCHIIESSYTFDKSIGGTGDYSEMTETTDYALDTELGQITPTSILPSGDVLRGTYRFRYKVRFAESKLSRRAFAYQLWNTGSQLVQVI